MSLPHISLIFVNYKSANYLAKALQSSRDYEKDSDFYEVIVVNNDVSESGALQTLQKTYPFVLIESGENMGFGRANNLGAQLARGAILGFINPDVVWMSAVLGMVNQVFNAEKKLGVLGLTLLDENKKREVWSYGPAPTLANLVYNNFFSEWGLGKKENSIYSDWVSAGALFIRQELFSSIGGFDERFFLYFEDVDLCAEARKRGFLVERYDNLSLMHWGGKSQNSVKNQKKYFYASQRKYFKKWRPRWENIALACLQRFLGKM